MSTSTITTPSSRVESVNPATEAVIASFDQFTPAQVEHALAEADAAFRDSRRHSIGERSTAMRRAAELLRSRKERYAGLITAEMGKPITQAEAEVEKCAWVCEYFADNAERFLARRPAQTNARLSYVAFEPLGMVLAVMPWNFPFWQVFRFAAPTLMAGNTAVLKHASNVPQCALAIEEVFRDAGFPRGALRSVLVPGGAVEAIIDDSRVRAVSLTGSNSTGEEGAHVVLGGAPQPGRGYFYQPTLVLTPRPPLPAGPHTLAPFPVGRGGMFDMPAWREETFGPVAVLVQAKDTDAAIALANDTIYGLGANLWTRDLARAQVLASRIEAGPVFINGMVASDPRLPFGGVKQSGYGRELSDFGIHEFVNIRTVWMSDG